MRIELDDAFCMRHAIDSSNPELIGKWFHEKAALLMTADSRMQVMRIAIWPSTEADYALLKDAHIPKTMHTADEMLEFVGGLLRISELMGNEVTSDEQI
jgi:hypothetical protein